MTRVIELNWNAFRTKFNGREHEMFEELCYLLFCREHGQYVGIFGYRNQTGIEKDPIELADKHIGFQVKFFDTKISDNEAIIKSGIQKAKAENPELDTIYYYLNQEFTESSTKGKKGTKYKSRIEATALKTGVEIVWRVPSNLLIQLNQTENLALAEYYFCLNTGVIDAIYNMQEHSNAILNSIKTQILYQSMIIKRDRTQLINNIKDTLIKTPAIILCGDGGVGKTALVKELISSSDNSYIFYTFRANELNVNTLFRFFEQWGQINLEGFINEHKDIQHKIVIIDSAEKLSDLEELTPLHELMSGLLKSGWNLIFTVRNRYLDVLKYQLSTILYCQPPTFIIPVIQMEELNDLSKSYSFKLPRNQKLIELIRTPFYLQEYLDYVKDETNEIDYRGFIDTLWGVRIMHSRYQKDGFHIRRKNCMIQIAKDKSLNPSFCIDPTKYDSEVLNKLAEDEILGYDEKRNSYFITHDVYEEWALDRFINAEFLNSQNSKAFLNEIGPALSVRRAFRVWLSEKLETEPQSVKLLISDSITDKTISAHYKDETLISILVSSHADRFVTMFEAKLSENNYELLIRLIFLLRTACKEFDDTLFNNLPSDNPDKTYLETAFTKPKGSGWGCIIDYIFKNIKNIDNLQVVIQLLQEWTNKFKTGETTRKASLIALIKYREMLESGSYFRHSHNDIIKIVVKTILNGASEISDELRKHFDIVLSTRENGIDDITESVLTSLTDSIEVIKAYPEYIVKLASHYWIDHDTNKDPNDYHRSYEMEMHFGLSRFCEHNYHPSSAFQTPLFFLLRYHPKTALDFIIEFVNQTVESYAKSERHAEVYEIEFSIGEQNHKQFIGNILWGMYRGFSAGTNVLESIHMALEKWLLWVASEDNIGIIEHLCKDLILRSKSASITSIIVSVLLAYPDKLFNVAVDLFKKREFFLYDTSRMVADNSSKSFYSFGYRIGVSEIYQEERIETCDQEFRKLSLERIAFNYQIFKISDDKEFERRRDVIWNIWDSHYSKIPLESDQTEVDKTWRLYLARMDSRKMTLKLESKEEDKAVYTLHPQIEPSLQAHSDHVLSSINDVFRFMRLKNWSDARFEKDKSKYTQYEEYDSDINKVISDTILVISELENGCDSSFESFYKSLPAYSIAVLIRDFSDNIDPDIMEIFKNVILKYASLPLTMKYGYQLSDGSEPSITTLPVLIEHFPELINDIKLVLLKLMLNESNVTIFARHSIQNLLWKISYSSAKSILIGYMMLDNSYESYRSEAYKESLRKGTYNSRYTNMEEFVEQNEGLVSRIINNDLTFEDIDVCGCNIRTLIIAIELLPLKVTDDELKRFFISALPILSQYLFNDKDKADHTLIYRLLDKFCPMVLFTDQSDIKAYLSSFINDFRFNQYSYHLFNQFLTIEDGYPHYSNFWIIWNMFFNKICEHCSLVDRNRHKKETIRYYLFAHPSWNEETKAWHTITENESAFYDKVVDRLGHCPTVLYSISKVLNDVGSRFSHEGIVWLSELISKHTFTQLEDHTVYYIENFVRRYILFNRQLVKTRKPLKDNVIVILNFLFEQGSTIGFLLREDIL